MPEYSNWDEFQWETEIRRHENSVADFFQGLVYCLDLPIDNSPAGWNNTAVQDPVTASDNIDQFTQWSQDEMEYEDIELSRMYEHRHPIIFSCVDALDQLAAEWNQFAVTLHDCKLQKTSLAVSCAFAKLLARTADFTEPSARLNSVALLVSLGKRTLTDIADLLIRLDNFSRLIPEEKSVITGFRQKLMLLRDQLIDRLFELRNSDEPPF
ncbi:MAG: hypothetical protein E7043_08225 [Lentisphaerae bacterium]|nr:hypothetical protein [Lentisphaerota bacterium]